MMCPSRPADSPRPPGMGKGLPARCPWGEDLPPLGVGPSPCLSHCVRAVIHRARSLLGADSVSGRRGLLSPVWHGGEEGPWAPMGVSERPHTALRPGQAVVMKAHAARAPLHETWAGVVSRWPPRPPQSTVLGAEVWDVRGREEECRSGQARVGCLGSGSGGSCTPEPRPPRFPALGPQPISCLLHRLWPQERGPAVKGLGTGPLVLSCVCRAPQHPSVG